MKTQASTKQLEELLLQALEHELGGVKVYAAAVECAVIEDLKQEWAKYLEQTQNHVSVLNDVCGAFSIDVNRETPGRRVVRHLGAALVDAMKLAQTAGDLAAAQLVACECVVLAETKDHLNWQLIGTCAQHFEEDIAAVLREAYAQVEDQEDEHLYHTKGWCRELWIESLGIPAVVPPPEEARQVKTAIGAAKAEQSAEALR